MDRKEKLLEHLRNNPTNVRFEDLDKLLRWHGFECDGAEGSHYTYIHDVVDPITIPRAKPVKTHYVKAALALLDQLRDLPE
jgi:antitoxin HicB